MGKALILCSKISVDCVYNDPVDVRCGGPDTLGFDFFVQKEETTHMKTFIKETLKSFNIPLISIYISTDSIEKEPDSVWDEERITECISKDASYLRSEASRNYGLYRRR